MLIVAGYLRVRPDERGPWVDAHHDIVQIPRRAPGCIALSFSADPIDQSRVNMFELWQSEQALEAWRAAADPPPKPEVVEATVRKYQISSFGRPF